MARDRNKQTIPSTNKNDRGRFNSAPASSGQADYPLPVNNPIWLRISEAAKISGVKNKTIRRAIKSGALRYKIISNKYYIELRTLILFLHKNIKLKNKLYNNGLGQYIKRWFD